MSIPQSAGGLIESRDDLVRHLSKGCKPVSEWRIGTEHEKFVYDCKTHKPIPYDGKPGIRQLLEGMTRFGWKPVMEGENIVGHTLNGASLSLEPGGQFELSGAALKSIHETCAEVNTHLDQVRAVANELNFGVLGMGYAPSWSLDEVPVMPKGRYQIMRRYMPKVGAYGLDMMFRTCTVQVNLDFESEADMVKKFRVGLALQPIATALFANSPFTEGKPNGYLSYRSQIWTDTDPDRSGMIPFVFEPGMGFERYVDHALGVPMYFVYRNGKYIDASGQSFRDFMAGKLPALPGELPTLRDWADHITTLFPEVRLKQFLEMRGADGGPWWRLCALPAFWTGLLYDTPALDAAWDLVKGWSIEEISALRDAVPKTALKTPFRKGTVREVADQVLKIAALGLTNRNRLSPSGEDEGHFLDSLRRIVATNETAAEELLALYHGRWQGSVDPAFKEFAY